jgi:predicted transcriptional regulator
LQLANSFINEHRMPRPASSQPTEVELQILRILWELGPSTVRDIHNRMTLSKDTGYSTTVKMLSVMLEKGLAKRDDSVRPQVYRAASTQARTQKKMLNEMIQKVYDGSAKSLVLQALSSTKASKQDLDEIRKLLDELT